MADPLPISFSVHFAKIKASGHIKDEITQRSYKEALSRKIGAYKTLVPPHFVSTNVYEAMGNAVVERQKHPYGMTYVYYAKSRSGKTVAARGVMELYILATSGKMPCVYVQSKGNIRKEMRRFMGVESESVSDSTHIDGMCTRMMEAVDDYQDVGSDSELLTRIKPLPLIIIDDVRTLSNEDKDFVDVLLRSAYESRILVFLLTDNERTANLLCSMDEMERVKPIPGLLDCESANEDYDTNEWQWSWKRVNWDKYLLSEMLLKMHPVKLLLKALKADDAGRQYLSFLVSKQHHESFHQSMSPDCAETKALQYITHKAPNSTLQKTWEATKNSN